MNRNPSKIHEEVSEESGDAVHRLPCEMGRCSLMSIYGPGDPFVLQNSSPMSTYVHSLSAIDELLERDKLREKDGFPRKIRVGRLVKPGRGSQGKIILVPTTVEEKFIHDVSSSEQGQGSSSGGTGEGEEGEVIGEEPIDGAEGAGTGGGRTGAGFRA